MRRADGTIRLNDGRQLYADPEDNCFVDKPITEGGGTKTRLDAAGCIEAGWGKRMQQAIFSMISISVSSVNMMNESEELNMEENEDQEWQGRSNEFKKQLSKVWHARTQYTCTTHTGFHPNS